MDAIFEAGPLVDYYHLLHLVSYYCLSTDLASLPCNSYWVNVTYPLLLVDEVGVEPTMPEAADLQSAGVTNFPTHPKSYTTDN